MFSLILSQAFSGCISDLTDPAEFLSPVPNVAHLLVAFEWQNMVLADKAGLCKDMKYSDLRKISLDSGMFLCLLWFQN